MTEDGQVVVETESGEKVEYVIDNYQDYNVAVGMCQTEGLEGFEVSPEFFQILVRGQQTPFLITGVPPVKVFPKGTMEKQLKIMALSIEKYRELLGKKAREEAAKKKAQEDEIDSL